MKYSITCLTPTLIGSGEALSPIDYMVWKDQVNVLDQQRIFKLLARGPRLDNYLNQIRRAEKLDFNSWGGFAQNFAGRRIALEHASLTNHWNRMPSDHLFIPEFASTPGGPYLPASALKGALRTAVAASRWQAKNIETLAERSKEGIPRHPGDTLETHTLGSPSYDLLRGLALGDSAPVARDRFRVYLWRTAKIEPRNNKLSLGWKAVGRGAVEANRPADSAARFAEMAAPGATFEGVWSEPARFAAESTQRALRWREAPAFGLFRDAAHAYAELALAAHEKFAQTAGLERLGGEIRRLRTALDAAKAKSDRLLLNIGWGGGLYGKTAWPHLDDANYRRVLGQLPYYARAISSGLPFPKTRRVVFLEDRPATLPGWIELRLIP